MKQAMAQTVEMVSKTRMNALVRSFEWKAVRDGLAETPELVTHRDERGRNWLHVCCSAHPVDTKAARASVRTADALLDLGIDIDEPAFLEGEWKATPLWYAVGRGRNLVLAKHLLELGCNPDYALWAACFNDDVDAIRLLVHNGATVDDPAVDETPFIAAVKVSHFGPAEVLLELGADVDTRDGNGMTALHYMLRKNSDKAHVRMLVDHGARGDIPDPRGVTAADAMGRKRDPEFKRMAEELRRR